MICSFNKRKAAPTLFPVVERFKSGASATNTLSPKDSISTGIGLMRSYPWIESIAHLIFLTLVGLSVFWAMDAGFAGATPMSGRSEKAPVGVGARKAEDPGAIHRQGWERLLC